MFWIMLAALHCVPALLRLVGYWTLKAMLYSSYTSSWLSFWFASLLILWSCGIDLPDAEAAAVLFSEVLITSLTFFLWRLWAFTPTYAEKSLRCFLFPFCCRDRFAAELAKVDGAWKWLEAVYTKCLFCIACCFCFEYTWGWSGLLLSWRSFGVIGCVICLKWAYVYLYFTLTTAAGRYALKLVNIPEFPAELITKLDWKTGDDGLKVAWPSIWESWTATGYGDSVRSFWSMAYGWLEICLSYCRYTFSCWIRLLFSLTSFPTTRTCDPDSSYSLIASEVLRL